MICTSSSPAIGWVLAAATGKSVVVSSNGIKSLRTVTANSLKKTDSLSVREIRIFGGYGSLAYVFALCWRDPYLKRKSRKTENSGFFCFAAYSK
ncbi:MULTISPECIES: hypothetical protein [unclassified Paenibacillus]|uniref:hypothetical protein n=1 Tax=unclassified Paenibacillus TaxID=185978 RepID=UPI000B28E759|nr:MULTISPECIES: hypothetical protein [unclassified Paenibacillus]